MLPATSYDTLTGLLNEVGAREELTTALAEARAEMSGVAVVCYTLQDSGTIAEHVGGDGMNSILRMFGARLRGQVRDEDFVARLRAAMFVVVLRVQSEFSATDASRRAAEISANVGAPLMVGRHTVSFVIHHGVAFAPDDGYEAEELLARAIAGLAKYVSP